MSQWFDECCAKDDKSFSTTTELYQSWAAFCRANDELPGSRKIFSQQLAGRAPILGIRKKKTNTASGFEGVEVLQSQVKKSGP
jgi:phage/plasmid-associated DNA primase